MVVIYVSIYIYIFDPIVIIHAPWQFQSYLMVKVDG